MEFPLSSDLVWPFVLVFAGWPVAAIGVFVCYARRRAENKVRMSSPIRRDDIVLLARTNSRWLDHAIALRCAQMEQGRNADDRAFL